MENIIHFFLDETSFFPYSPLLYHLSASNASTSEFNVERTKMPGTTILFEMKTHSAIECLEVMP